MSLKSYRDLQVWQLAMDLTELVYAITKEYPSDERFGLVSQSRKSAVSVPSNIAEGYGRTHRGDYLKFLSNARGSLCELETQLILAVRLKFVTREAVIPAWKVCQQIGKMLRRMILKLADDHHPKPQSTAPPAQ